MTPLKPISVDDVSPARDQARRSRRHHRRVRFPVRRDEGERGVEAQQRGFDRRSHIAVRAGPQSTGADRRVRDQADSRARAGHLQRHRHRRSQGPAGREARRRLVDAAEPCDPDTPSETHVEAPALPSPQHAPPWPMACSGSLLERAVHPSQLRGHPPDRHPCSVAPRFPDSRLRLRHPPRERRRNHPRPLARRRPLDRRQRRSLPPRFREHLRPRSRRLAHPPSLARASLACEVCGDIDCAGTCSDCGSSLCAGEAHDELCAIRYPSGPPGEDDA